MSKITAEKRPTGKKPPSIPVSMSDSEQWRIQDFPEGGA